MFVWAPFMILGAPYESTMGLVQKIFYFHAPIGMVMFTVGVRVRRRQRHLSVHAAPLGGSLRRRRRRADGRARDHRAGHRAAVGAQGVGRVVAVGRAADLDAGACG